VVQGFGADHLQKTHFGIDCALHYPDTYRVQARFEWHDQVNGSIWMEKFDSSGWMANMEFMVNGKLAAMANQGGVFINIGTMKPANPPEGLQKKYDEERR